MLRIADNIISLSFRAAARSAATCRKISASVKIAKMLPLVKGETCLRCGRGLELCSCGNQHFAFERCTATFYYEGAVKQP